MKITYSICLILLTSFSSLAQLAVLSGSDASSDAFSLEKAILYVDQSESFLIHKAAELLARDIQHVTGQQPDVTISDSSLSGEVVIIGTIEGNTLIKRLVEQKKINTSEITDKWEHFLVQTIEQPLPNIERALIIAGSDKRGTAYGVFSISEAIGVSPWYWWADVPVKQHKHLQFSINQRHIDGPVVKYRGIFINDEAPALRNWATEKFGGINHVFYQKVFELILRNKGNYLWPAMWLPTIFNEDDPLNAKTADDYGIVISTSHHEPMMRSHNEWHEFDGGAWNYETNKSKLTEFWKGGVERMGEFESVVTVGMRGDGDEGMSDETAVELLKTIIKDQREILREVTGKPAEETQQVWAVYKEVQDYYDKGMRVDDDIIILFCDDNWGNLRILPKQEDLDHKGGYGIYYHFDYVGAPVSYKWLNTTQIERTWEQMNLAYTHGVKDLWLVNVGDIKPMELPISFFLDQAWNPSKFKANNLTAYYIKWSARQFGDEYATDIAQLLASYTKYNARRTPEMLTPSTYSVESYREADRIVAEYQALLAKSNAIRKKLHPDYESAYYQLVHSPIELCTNLNEMYVAAGKNQYYAEHGAVAANYYADLTRKLFEKDAQLTKYFHDELEGGKWKHMMSQTHIGYTYWNHPPLNSMPAISYVEPASDSAQLGFLIEHGQRPKWGWLDVEGDWSFSVKMPEFDPANDQNYYIDIINRGKKTLEYTLNTQEQWLRISKTSGSVRYHEKVFVSIDWSKAPGGVAIGHIDILGAGTRYTVQVPINNPSADISGFVENNGYVSINANHFSRKYSNGIISWDIVPNLGRTGSSVIVQPSNLSRQELTKNSPRLEYDFWVKEAGKIKVHHYLSPTQDFRKSDGLHFAVSIDQEAPLVINMNEGERKPDYEYAEWWTESVGDHIKIKLSEHYLLDPGKHTLKVWMIDPGIVFQQFVIDTGSLRSSYLGPPESRLLESPNSN